MPIGIKLGAGWTRTGLVLCASLLGLYLFSRVYVATHFPIFIDEAIHVDWASPSDETIPPSDPSYDGKWLSVKLFELASSADFPFDELVASRLLVVALGLSTALACYLIGRELFSAGAGALAASLYVFLPFTLIYDSLAMADGVQAAFGAWATLSAVRLARSPSRVYSAALALLLAAAILAKFSGLVLLALPLLAVLLLTPRARRGEGLLRAAPALVASLGLSIFLYERGMLQVLRWKAAEGPAASLGERVWENLALAGGWFWGLLTPTVALVAAAAFVWLLVSERSRAGLFVVALLCLDVLPYVVMSRTWYPRYLLASVIPLALAAGQLLATAGAWARRRWRGRRALAAAAASLVAAGALGWPALRSGAVLFDLPEAGLPWMERYQFVTGWPSGYGVRELAAFLQAQGAATPGGVTVARTTFVDHPLQSLNLYLTPSPSLSLYTLSDEDTSSAESLASLSARRRTLLVLSTENGTPQRVREASAPLLKCGKPVWSYARPGGASGFVVYDLACGGWRAPRK